MTLNTRALTARGVLLPALAGSALAGPALAQTADLSYKWREGVSLTYEINQEMRQEAETPFGNTSTVLNTAMVQTMKVVGVRRGDGQIEVTTDSTRVEGDLGMGNRISYDSENARDRRRASDPSIAPFAFLVGKTYTVTLNEAGEVEALDGYAEHVEDLLRRMSDPAMKAALQMSLTESMFESQLEQFWHVVPGEEVEVGDTWSTRMTQAIPNLGEVVIETVYTFDSVESMEGMDVAVILATGHARMGGAGVPGMRIEITESSFEGTFSFAYDLGLILEAEQDQSMLIQVRAQGQTVTQSIEASTFAELVDVQGLDLEPAADGPDEAVEAPAEPPAADPAAEPAPTPAPPAGSDRPGGRKP